MYKIQLTKKSKQFLKGLQKKEIEIILKKLNSIRETPFHFLKKYKDNNLFGLRILKFRCVIDVIVIKNQIIVLRIGHRKNIYKK